MASIQKSYSGFEIKLKKPIVIKLEGNSLLDRLWSNKGFNKFIHNLSDDEHKNIKAAEVQLNKAIRAASGVIEHATRGRTDLTSMITHKDRVDSVFLTVPAEVLPKLKSKTRGEVSMTVVVRGVSINTSHDHHGIAYVNYSTEYVIKETDAVDLVMDFE